ncbi:PTPRA [Mytilus coruscus]|uniref:PTPRA n=1 Tax=Mytilus coruscus TaxID=42192 RepID=A0A6J8DAN7_MYTCO|nr:PTPRA [Mytilus coruscus]
MKRIADKSTGIFLEHIGYSGLCLSKVIACDMPFYFYSIVERQKQQKYENKVPVIIGTSLSVAVFLLILFAVIVLFIKRRRVKKGQESSYETNEMINAEAHPYGKTATYHQYCNSDIKQTTVPINDIPLMEEDFLLEKYNVFELTRRLSDADLLKARIRAEFMFLESNSLKVEISTNDYEIVLNENKTDDVFKVAMLEIEMRSAEKTNDNIFMLRFTLHDKKSRTKHDVKIFKTNWDDSDKYPSVESICSLLDKVKIEEGRPILITGSKGKGFSVCGAVSLCLHSVRAIERETTLSLLEYATFLKRIEDDFIKVLEDYEFCYEVMAQYLETIHTYSFIE